jgi:hypothetical protein
MPREGQVPAVSGGIVRTSDRIVHSGHVAALRLFDIRHCRSFTNHSCGGPFLDRPHRPGEWGGSRARPAADSALWSDQLAQLRELLGGALDRPSAQPLQEDV